MRAGAGQAVALATGRPILGERVHHAAPAWVLNLEDPLDELNRRLAACLRLHGVPDAAVPAGCFSIPAASGGCTMAALDARDMVVAHPDRDAVVGGGQGAAGRLIVVDPFVKSHAARREHQPPHGRRRHRLGARWRRRPGRQCCWCTTCARARRRGGDVEAARGAKALTDAARAAACSAPWRPEEAEAPRRVADAERWRHVRLDDAKANMAPRAEAAHVVPAGERSARQCDRRSTRPATRWRRWRLEAARPVRGFLAADCQPRARPDRRRPGAGGAVGRRQRGGGLAAERWAGTVLIANSAWTRRQAAGVIAAWLRYGLLEETPYRDAGAAQARAAACGWIDARRPTVSATNRARHGADP